MATPPAKFTVPPLDQTVLLSTPELTGVADSVALQVMPLNTSICGTVPHVPPPDTFDFREEFAEYIAPIINQGSCGSCWAIASTQSLSSRFALFRNQRAQPLSAAYMLYCIRDTFSTKRQDAGGYGCSGGSLVDAFWFFKIEGTVAAKCLRYDALATWDPTAAVDSTGLNQRRVGDAPSVVTCPLLSCPSSPSPSPSPDDDDDDNQPWQYRTAVSYIVAGTPRQNGGSEANIRQEIWSRGPVATGFQVTQDFVEFWKKMLVPGKAADAVDPVYVPGVPDDFTNPVMGSHAVQLVGWGQDAGADSLPYWIVANSWGATTTALNDYANNGYFKMVRGRNAAAIESNVVTGVPKVHPNVVGALGRPASAQDAQLCNMIGYELKRESLALLSGGKFMPIPDPHSSYDFTLPPISPATVAHVHSFKTCPSDRPVSCATTGVCVTQPQQCGTMRPTQGVVGKNLTTDPYQAAAREIKSKYLQQHYMRGGRERERDGVVVVVDDDDVRRQRVFRMSCLFVFIFVVMIGLVAVACASSSRA